MELSIIIPTLNEAKNLEVLFRRIAKLRLRNYEIVVADSASKDDTVAIAKNLASNLKTPIKVIQTGKTDLSNAVVMAISKTRSDVVAVIDADLQHPPELLPKMLKTLERKRADIVIASRFAKGSKTKLSLWRIFVSKVYIFLSHIFVPETSFIKDTSAGYFAFRKKILRNIKLEPIGFKILLEILAKAKCGKDKTIEIPFSFSERSQGKSKFSFRQSIIAFRHLLKLAMHAKEHHKFLKFLAVGASGIIVNEGLLWVLTEFAGVFYIVSSLIAIETSILSNFILNDVWTFRQERKGKFFTRLGKFNLARLFALGINLGALALFVSLGLHYLIANLIGIAIATVFTYLSSLWWVWK